MLTRLHVILLYNSTVDSYITLCAVQRISSFGAVICRYIIYIKKSQVYYIVRYTCARTVILLLCVLLLLIINETPPLQLSSRGII